MTRINRIIKYVCCTLLIISMLFVVSCKNNSQPNNNTKTTDTTKNSSDNKVSEKKDNVKKYTEEELAQIERQMKIKERAELEEQRKEEYKEFYVPLKDLDSKNEKTKKDVKALYATGYTAGNSLDQSNIDYYGKYVAALRENDSENIAKYRDGINKANRMEKIVSIVNQTEINAIVFDVKDDYGHVTYSSNVDIINQVNKNVNPKIEDIKKTLKILKDNNVYTIARIVVFKDKNFASNFPEHSIQLKTGGVWYDKYSNGVPWVNPFDKYVWDYNVAIAKEAALLGFDEINFDYIRFPDNAKYYNNIVKFEGRDGLDKDKCIRNFLDYTKKELEPYSINVSADVFGLITRSFNDYPEDIGQTWFEMADKIDYICPMVYPSHYGPGWYGLNNPNAHPYEVIKGSMQEALEKTSAMKNPAGVRPWIQDFNWAGKVYGRNEIRAQVIAAKELGINEYLVWNPSNIYDPMCFIETKDELMSKYPVEIVDLDYRNRSASRAINYYLESAVRENLNHLYILTPKNERSELFDDFVTDYEKNNNKILNYKINSISIDENNKQKYIVNIDYTTKVVEDSEEKTVENKDVVWTVQKEDGIWKIYKNNELS